MPESPESQPQALVWFRRDLRVEDHAALYHALKNHRAVCGVFVFDQDILDHLPAHDRRVAFIWQSVQELKQLMGGALIVRHAHAVREIPRLARALGVAAVYVNHDDEPAALRRDEQVREALHQHGIQWKDYKDQVIFERKEVLTAAAGVYSVFTPYKNAWLKKCTAFFISAYPSERYLAHLCAPKGGVAEAMPSLASMGFAHSACMLSGGVSRAKTLLADFASRLPHYRAARDYPAVKGPSYLSVHLRFGTVSIRACARLAWKQQDEGSQTWLSELIWRDFYMQLLANCPKVADSAFKPAYDAIRWRNDTAQFERWCTGQTGYPLVDAAMRQLNHSGYMHNRLRMVTASFLCKHLHIDWRWGERYFAAQLLDFDLAANNGGWQWASSSGCDAQPYFRIFNPITQSQKFDSKGAFIRRYVPELGKLSDKDIHAPWLASPVALMAAQVRLGEDYPMPIVDHAAARAHTLSMYRQALQPEAEAARATS
jgi:deoxyribodipyrimidine photo-lyase